MSQTGSEGDLIWWGLRCPVRIVLPPCWFISLSPFVVQEPEPDDSGPGEVSSWDVNTERPTSTVGKLSKTESQNHMSPRYSADVHIWKHADKIVSLCFYKSYFTFTSVSLQHLGLTQKYFWKSKRLGFFSLPRTYLHSHSFHSKMENRLQRRPRSTSMKDRQNSKAQSDRTSSMESECSPDSRLIAQVTCYSIWFLVFWVFFLSVTFNVWGIVCLCIILLLWRTKQFCSLYVFIHQFTGHDVLIWCLTSWLVVNESNIQLKKK